MGRPLRPAPCPVPRDPCPPPRLPAPPSPGRFIGRPPTISPQPGYPRRMRLRTKHARPGRKERRARPPASCLAGHAPRPAAPGPPTASVERASAHCELSTPARPSACAGRRRPAGLLLHRLVHGCSPSPPPPPRPPTTAAHPRPCLLAAGFASPVRHMERYIAPACSLSRTRCAGLSRQDERHPRARVHAAAAAPPSPSPGSLPVQPRSLLVSLLLTRSAARGTSPHIAHLPADERLVILVMPAAGAARPTFSSAAWPLAPHIRLSPTPAHSRTRRRMPGLAIKLGALCFGCDSHRRGVHTLKMQHALSSAA